MHMLNKVIMHACVVRQCGKALTRVNLCTALNDASNLHKAKDASFGWHFS
jgi:hypothetical protein